MKAVSTFRSLVAAYAPTCPTPYIDQAVVETCRRFCRATHAVQEVTAQNLTVGEVDYDVDVPQYMQLTAVLAVWAGARQLKLVGTDEVRSSLAQVGDVGTTEAVDADPIFVFQKIPSGPTLSLYPIPVTAMTNGLIIRAAFEPTLTATYVEDILYDRYAEAIAYGAAARVLELPGQPFTDPGRAQQYKALFESAIGQASATARSGQVRRTLRVQARNFTFR